MMSCLQYVRLEGRGPECDEIIFNRLRRIARKHECGRAIDEPYHDAAVVGVHARYGSVGREYLEVRSSAKVDNLSAHRDYFPCILISHCLIERRERLCIPFDT